MLREAGHDQTSQFRKAIPFLWLALSAAWVVVIFVTDVPAWPLAVWIATTIGPIAALQARTRRTASKDAVDSPTIDRL